jgi:tellurite resistance protein TerB
MVLDWLKANTAAAKSAIMTEVGKFKNAKFLEGVIAASAKMAYADGMVDPKEKQKMMGIVQNSDVLSVFKVEDVIAMWKKWAAKYDNDKDFADMEALSAVGKNRDDENAARTLVRVAIIVANSDGNFDKNEIHAAIDICKELRLDPADFNLAV